MSDYIGISEQKMKHILEVSRYMYDKAKKDLKSEKYSRKMFLLGYLHDIGYEFSEENIDHPFIAKDILDSVNFDLSKQVLNHGNPIKGIMEDTYAMDLLDEADLMVNSRGEKVGAYKRLKDIDLRYGKESIQYQNALKLANKLNLLKDREVEEFNDNLNRSEFTKKQLEQIDLGYERNLNISLYAKKEITHPIMFEIRVFLQHEIDEEIIKKILKMDFNNRQLIQLRLGIEENIDYETYLNSDISAEDMERIRKELSGL